MIKVSTSKILLFFVMVAYFVVLFVGILFVDRTITTTPEYSMQALTALFSYAGSPAVAVIGFYSWKAKNENCTNQGG